MKRTFVKTATIKEYLSKDDIFNLLPRVLKEFLKKMYAATDIEKYNIEFSTNKIVVEGKSEYLLSMSWRVEENEIPQKV